MAQPSSSDRSSSPVLSDPPPPTLSNPSTKKRARPTSFVPYPFPPAPPGTPAMVFGGNALKVTLHASDYLNLLADPSTSPSLVVEILNDLLAVTANADLNYTLLGPKRTSSTLTDVFQPPSEDLVRPSFLPSRILDALIFRLLEALSLDPHDFEGVYWGSEYGGGEAASNTDAERSPDGVSSALSNIWSTPPSDAVLDPLLAAAAGPKAATASANANKVTQILAIVRNLAFVSANERHLANHCGLLRVLTACLCVKRDWDGTRLAVEALLCCSEHLSVSLASRFESLLLLSNACDERQEIWGEGGAVRLLGLGRAFAVRSGERAVNPRVAALFGGPYVCSVARLLSAAVCLVVSGPAVRINAILGLELVTALAKSEDNRAAFERVPDELLEAVVKLMAMPKHGVDSLGYAPPRPHLQPTRISGYFLPESWEDFVDHELRDRALDCLARLSSLSVKIKTRIGKVPGAVELIIKALGTKVGRADAQYVVGSIVANLAAVPENRERFREFSRHLIVEASKDKFIATLVFNNGII